MKPKQKVSQHDMWSEKGAQPTAEVNSEEYKICVWNPTRPRVYCPPGFGEDPYAEENALADMLADVAPLYVKDETLVLLENGKLRPVDIGVLRELVARHIKIPRLVNHGTEDAPDWACEYAPFEASESTLEALLTAENWFEGSLVARVPLA
jgi:hypothetical protein